MSVKVTIEHGGGKFKRELLIHRVETRGEGFDIRHLYEVEQRGGRRWIATRFEHRYGDPLATLVAEALKALQSHPDADPALFEVQNEKVSEYIVLRTTKDTPPALRGHDGYWLYRKHITPYAIYPGDPSAASEARPTGRYETREDGERAEVYEIGRLND